jgi:hypothetical protein
MIPTPGLGYTGLKDAIGDFPIWQWIIFHRRGRKKVAEKKFGVKIATQA